MDFQDKFVLNNLIITYSEYREAVEGKTYESMAKKMEDDVDMPDWFVKYQKKAIALFRKVVAQVHCLPRNRLDYLDLKPQMWVEEGTNIYHTEPMNYQELFKNALAEQIKFMNDNEIMIDNGYINMQGFSVASYNQAGQQMYAVNKLFKGLHPSAYDSLESMGWMNSCLNHPLEARIFYKGEC